MIFCRGSKRNLLELKNLFKEYGEAFGQIMSLSKCKFFIGPMASWGINSIAGTLGFTVEKLPFSYLGVPIFKGKPRRTHLQPIADRIKAKLATWKGSLLSIMGRVQLVKSIIHDMLLCSFHIYVWLISLLKTIDTWLRNFIWSGDINVRKIVSVACHRICNPTVEGGLGLRSVRKINEAATMKLCWDFLSSNGQWACFLNARYLRNKVPISHHLSSSIWHDLKSYF